MQYFLSGYVPYLMEVAMHPEMEALHRLMYGPQAGRFVFNHCHLLTRQPGYEGGGWHSHPNRDGADGAGPATSEAEYEASGLGIIFTFGYPDGFSSAEGEGGLKICRGSHLYRDPSNCRGGLTDESFEEGWMKGKRHPISGEMLAIERLALPPGSVVSVCAHLAHGVSSRTDPGAGATSTPRYGSLWSYRLLDPAHPPTNEVPVGGGGHGIPPSLQLAAESGVLPERCAALIPPR